VNITETSAGYSMKDIFNSFLAKAMSQCEFLNENVGVVFYFFLFIF